MSQTKLSAPEIAAKYAAIRKELAKRIVGQHDVIEKLVTAFFAGGHCLLVGVPGLAKTLLIRSFAEVLGLDFNRIQFTPDLMPSDVIGTDVIAQSDGQRDFAFLSGPIFANMILADEINRTPPKTQSSLLEAMEEQQVTSAGVQYPLPSPFFVMATQNPIEQEGTYPLPIAALDRFMFHVEVDYPKEAEELEMLFQTTSHGESGLNQILSRDEVAAILESVRSAELPDDLLAYATHLVRETRPTQTSLDYIKEMAEVGGSPRAVQSVILAAKARAMLSGRAEATAEDIREVCVPALRHRVIPSFMATADSISVDQIVLHVIVHTPAPDGWTLAPEVRKRRFGLKRLLFGEPKRKVFEPDIVTISSASAVSAK